LGKFVDAHAIHIYIEQLVRVCMGSWNIFWCIYWSSWKPKCHICYDMCLL